MNQFDWPALVDEAIVRRKEEQLTQKKHAALAGVSIPTMISFERAETTISIEKVLAILGVVGMVPKQKMPANKLEIFEVEASQRWFELTKMLDKDSPARQLYGHVCYTFEVDGPLKEMSLPTFERHLREISQTKTSGWPPFLMPSRQDIKPYPIDHQTFECWLGKPSLLTDLSMNKPAYTDFWRISKQGYVCLQRGYVEDSQDIPPAGEIFDLSLPIRFTAEVVCYAYRFAKAMSQISEKTFINLHIKYSGLQGRILANWSDPSQPLYEKKRSTYDSAEMSISFSLHDVKDPLYESVAKIVHRLLKDLYANFDFYELPYEFTESHLRKMLE